MIEEFKDVSEVQLIIFRLGSEEYGVPITSVQEIIMRQSPTHIPNSPVWIEGVINLRGRIIPIIDGDKKFSLSGNVNNKNDERIIVLDVEHEIIGLIVDEVSEVIHLKTENIDDTPVDMEDSSNFIWGIGKYQDKLLILIDPKKFLSHTEVHDLKKIADSSDAVNESKESALF